MIVLLAVGGAVLLRSRGVQGASSARGLTTPDPFIAAVPALLGLAAALVAMRLYPLVMRGVARVASWGRDLVPALAMRQAARGGTGGPMLLVLLATVALGAFSSATLVHLDRAADAVAWQETGADFRVSRGGDRLPGDLDPGALPGVEASAREITYTATYATRGIRLDLLAVDAPAYAGVAAGTPVAPEWPAELLGSAPTGALPVIVSSDLAEGKDPLAVGDPVEIVVEGRQLPLRVVEIRPTFPSVAIGDPFLVVALDHLAAMVPTLAEPTTSVFIRAADPAAAGLREALAVEDVGATLDGRAERAAELRSTPVIGAVTVGVAVAAIIALAYAGLAVAASLILSGAARAGEVAMLRTLGLSTRQSFALIVVEHGPTVVVAFIAGTVLGLGLFAVLRPGLGLGTVVGSPLDIPLAVDPGQLLLLLGAILVIVAVSIGLAGALQRSVAPVDALRGGIE
jgi:putative ABC transport system permease protein